MLGGRRNIGEFLVDENTGNDERQSKEAVHGRRLAIKNELQKSSDEER